MTTPPTVEYRTIELTQGQVAYVSPNRYEELNKFKWYAHWNGKGRCFYAVRNSPKIGGKRHMIFMHRYIVGLGHLNPKTGDHKDHTRTLDNTDENLRFASNFEQRRNRGKHRNNKSGYKGVSFSKRARDGSHRFRSRENVNGLGTLIRPHLHTWHTVLPQRIITENSRR